MTDPQDHITDEAHTLRNIAAVLILAVVFIFVMGMAAGYLLRGVV